MNFEQLQSETETKPDYKSLLLIPEQVAKEAERRGEPPYVIQEKQGGSEITIYGAGHKLELSKIKAEAEMFESQNPDMLLVEGGLKDILVEVKENNLSDEEVVNKYGEQAYLTLLAQRKGVEVKSWDTPPLEQLEYVLKKGHSPEAIIGWMTFQLAKINLESEHIPTLDVLIEQMKIFLSADVLEKIKKEFDKDLSPENFNLEELAKKFAGVSLSEITPDIAEKFVGPALKGETNAVIRAMSQMRDERAIEIIEEAKKNHKKVFVSAGSHHALTWEPATKEMYRENQG